MELQYSCCLIHVPPISLDQNLMPVLLRPSPFHRPYYWETMNIPLLNQTSISQIVCGTVKVYEIVLHGLTPVQQSVDYN